MNNYQIQKALNRLFPGVGAVVNGDYGSENFFIKLDDPNLTIPSFEELEAASNIIELEQAKKEKCKEVNKQRDALKDCPISFNGNLFQRGILSQLAFVNANQTMDGSGSIEWITEENDTVFLSKDDILNICIAIRDRDSALYLAARAIKDQILALTTIEEVSGYEIILE